MRFFVAFVVSLLVSATKTNTPAHPNHANIRCKSAHCWIVELPKVTRNSFGALLSVEYQPSHVLLGSPLHQQDDDSDTTDHANDQVYSVHFKAGQLPEVVENSVEPLYVEYSPPRVLLSSPRYYDDDSNTTDTFSFAKAIDSNTGVHSDQFESEQSISKVTKNSVEALRVLLGFQQQDGDSNTTDTFSFTNAIDTNTGVHSDQFESAQSLSEVTKNSAEPLRVLLLSPPHHPQDGDSNFTDHANDQVYSVHFKAAQLAEVVENSAERVYVEYPPPHLLLLSPPDHADDSNTTDTFSSTKAIDTSTWVHSDGFQAAQSLSKVTRNAVELSRVECPPARILLVTPLQQDSYLYPNATETLSCTTETIHRDVSPFAFFYGHGWGLDQLVVEGYHFLAVPLDVRLKQVEAFVRIALILISTFWAIFLMVVLIMYLSGVLILRLPPQHTRRKVDSRRKKKKVKSSRNKNVKSSRNRTVKSARSKKVESIRSENVKSTHSKKCESTRSKKCEFPRSEKVESTRSKKFESTRSKKFESTRSKKFESTRSKKFESTRSKKFESTRSKKFESTRSKKFESSQRENAESIRNRHIEFDLQTTLVGHGYRLAKEIGRGGFGVVQKALRGGKRYAAKYVYHGAEDTEQMIDDEVGFLEMFKCSDGERNGIVQFHEKIKGAYGTFIVMEMCKGMDLHDHVTKPGQGRLFSYDYHVRNVADMLLKAVLVLHEQGVVHMDIKPANIFLHRRGHKKAVLVLLDLGLCLRLPSSGKLYNRWGTEGYMAPEVRDKNRGCDFKADVYSIGCTLYFLLTGETMEKCADPWNHPMIKDQEDTVEYLKKLTDPDPSKRLSVEDAMYESWVMDLD